MIAFLSPAKNMRPAPAPGVPLTRPVFQREADRLASLLRKYSPWELESLLQINPSHRHEGRRAITRILPKPPPPPPCRPIMGWPSSTWTPLPHPEDYAWAGEHLRILSALYGVLRPPTASVPTGWKSSPAWRVEGQSLYAFWGGTDRPGAVQNRGAGDPSGFRRVRPAVLPHRRPGDICITCEFSILRRGKRTTLATGRQNGEGRDGSLSRQKPPGAAHRSAGLRVGWLRLRPRLVGRNPLCFPANARSTGYYKEYGMILIPFVK